MTNNSGTRLGHILLKKRLVTPEQLSIGIAEQLKRRLQIDPLDTKSYSTTSLGEILIELGFIDRLQLYRGLNWQMIVRNVTLAMSLCAPLLTISSGAAAQITSSTSTSSSTRSYSLPLTIQAENYSAMKNVSAAPTTDTGGGSYIGWIDADDWIVYGNTLVSIPLTGSYKIIYRVASLNGGGKFLLREAGANFTHDVVDVPKTAGWQNWISVQKTITLTAGVHIFGIKAVVGGFNINWFRIESVSTNSISSSSSMPALASSIAASSKPASSVAASSRPASSSGPTSGLISTQVSGPVEMKWIAPNLRENGSVLDITELGGYELRYKLLADANFTYISINDPWTNFYNFAWLEGNYVFQIAAFDKNGLYSNFVSVLQN